MATRFCGLCLLAIAAALVPAAHGDGPLCSSAAAGQSAGDRQHSCGAPPGPGPEDAAAAAAASPSEAAAAGGAAAAAASLHLLQAELRAPGAAGGLLVAGGGGGGPAPPAPPAGGLRFLHIPRTGGSSIEVANFLLPPGRQAYSTLAHDTFSCLQATLFKGSSLAAIYNLTHDDMGKYTLISASSRCYHWMTIGTLSSRDVCLDLHYPPTESTLLQAYYQQGPTFCAVREPSARLLSALRVNRNFGGSFMGPLGASQAIDCSVAAYDDAIARLIRDEIPKRPFQHNCFYVHQADFAAYCKHTIHTEALADEFAALMRSYGLNVTLPSWRVGDDWTETCNIKVANLSNSTKQLMYDFLKVDYDFLGYPPPF